MAAAPSSVASSAAMASGLRDGTGVGMGVMVTVKLSMPFSYVAQPLGPPPPKREKPNVMGAPVAETSRPELLRSSAVRVEPGAYHLPSNQGLLLTTDSGAFLLWVAFWRRGYAASR